MPLSPSSPAVGPCPSPSLPLLVRWERGSATPSIARLPSGADRGLGFVPFRGLGFVPFPSLPSWTVGRRCPAVSTAGGHSPSFPRWFAPTSGGGTHAQPPPFGPESLHAAPCCRSNPSSDGAKMSAGQAVVGTAPMSVPETGAPAPSCTLSGSRGRPPVPFYPNRAATARNRVSAVSSSSAMLAAISAGGGRLAGSVAPSSRSQDRLRSSRSRAANSA